MGCILSTNIFHNTDNYTDQQTEYPNKNEFNDRTFVHILNTSAKFLNISIIILTINISITLQFPYENNSQCYHKL